MLSKIQIENKTEIKQIYNESYADLDSGGVYHEHYSDSGNYYDWDSDSDD